MSRKKYIEKIEPLYFEKPQEKIYETKKEIWKQNEGKAVVRPIAIPKAIDPRFTYHPVRGYMRVEDHIKIRG